MFDIDMIVKAIDNGEWIGEGVARRGIQISDKVVAKIPLKINTLQTEHEINFYEFHEEKYGKYMAKMYGYMTNIPHYGTVIFMEKVQPIDRTVVSFLIENFKSLGDKGNFALEEKIAEIHEFESEVSLVDSSDNHGNWGVNDNGDLVVLDCGISSDPIFDDVNTWNRGYSDHCYGDCDYCRNNVCVG